MVLSIQIFQLHIEHGGLHLIDTRIQPLIIMYIFLMTTIITNGSDKLSQFLVVGGDGTCITQGAKVLTRIKAVASGIAETTCLSALEGTAMGLGIVFDELQAILSTEDCHP